MYGQFTLPSEITSHHITVDEQDTGARFRIGSVPGLYGLEAGSKIAVFNWDNKALSTCLVLMQSFRSWRPHVILENFE